jgi:hypothetical protein
MILVCSAAPAADLARIHVTRTGVASEGCPRNYLQGRSTTTTSYITAQFIGSLPSNENAYLPDCDAHLVHVAMVLVVAVLVAADGYRAGIRNRSNRNGLGERRAVHDHTDLSAVLEAGNGVPTGVRTTEFPSAAGNALMGTDTALRAVARLLGCDLCLVGARTFTRAVQRGHLIEVGRPRSRRRVPVGGHVAHLSKEG